MDKYKRDLLIEQYIGLPVHIANKFRHTGIELDELVSVGKLGLVEAAHAFNPEEKISFMTYAYMCIWNRIGMYLRRIRRSKRREVYLESIIGADQDGNDYCLGNILGTEPDTVTHGLETEAERNILHSAIGTLPERERGVICLRYGIESKDACRYRQEDIAERFGLSQSMISRLEKKALGHLRKKILSLEGENDSGNKLGTKEKGVMKGRYDCQYMTTGGVSVENFRYPVIDIARTGIRIKNRMMQAGVSPRDIGAALGFSTTHVIYAWMAGKRLPSIRSLYALSELLGVPIDDFVVGSRRKESHWVQHIR